MLAVLSSSFPWQNLLLALYHKTRGKGWHFPLKNSQIELTMETARAMITNVERQRGLVAQMRKQASALRTSRKICYDTTDFSALRALKILQPFAVLSLSFGNRYGSCLFGSRGRKCVSKLPPCGLLDPCIITSSGQGENPYRRYSPRVG